MKPFRQRTNSAPKEAGKQISAARLRARILFILVIGAVFSSVISVAAGSDFAGMLGNIGAELGGAALTFYLLDQLLATRERQEAISEAEMRLKTDLINRMSSNVREVAVTAADELRRHDWLQDGSLVDVVLRRADLTGANLANAQLRAANLHRTILNNADFLNANLQDADLSGAWLQHARLWDANLEGANLWQARLHNADLRRASLEDARLNETRLSGADLRDANLRHANLNNAKLQGATLRGANLSDADLQDAQLQGADLRDAILTGANLTEAGFDDHTLMPDGKRWNAGMDVNAYTLTGG